MGDDTPKQPYAATRRALAQAMADIDAVLPGSVSSAAPGAASTTVPARPTRRSCTARTSSGPAPSTAKP